MKVFFQSVSWMFVLLLLLSCGTRQSYPPVIRIPSGEGSRQYNYSVSFRKRQMDGILLVRQVNEKEVRFLFSTYFGMSVFDYSLRGDSFCVNNCIAPLRNKHVEALMANDFRILFTGNASDSLSNTLKPIEKRTEGRGLLKSKVTINGTSAGNPDSVRIHHPLLRLTMCISRSDDMLQEDEPEEIQDSITDPGV